ncbi:MAG: hypothetical protein COY75_03140 [Nitrospirae bacterium CG_4_10_14_0_8_um_filter_41_23]|nr:MAG: hypothetical protein COV68_09205 [Nitrospirae bacterium CG11_big_fil_rev_8_21_14_0_20_41_14]PIV43094.1 MAG: hypothetical protein COS27_05705 [Nitrospirae bacterium CG02_land_8_20_14_3_00_41_53]PIW88197.1 MAG: hypothetical protein COZ94_01050 [Nitrospirae bacterium CG_4_8_14_3_um_filter_41_47]PIY87361.1 MAG: hypothetical protein COY75_03140 [Nitrospirae bacterium CG_4_10_14_0_8_um_filter_41_23]PJA79346.1 MAG: hypothetical protein CO148_08055 [Nitrospirae bacterium CG_4_9_14_3_um_filter_4
MIGILAYGSLIKSPGQDIAALVVKRIPMKTPFPIEFARYSRKRAGAPTVVPVRKGGRRVNAQILVLREDTTLQRAKTILWLREINQVGASREYTSNRAKLFKYEPCPAFAASQLFFTRTSMHRLKYDGPIQRTWQKEP